MLNPKLCELCGVDKIEQVFVDTIDEIDDQLELEPAGFKRSALLYRKENIIKARQYYIDLQKNRE